LAVLDELKPVSTQGDPHEIWYRFGGKQMGHVGNNCTTDVDYQASIAQRTAAAPTGTPGAFRNGASIGASYSDFDQSYNPINSYEQGSGGGGYVVRKGDTLQGLAAGLYGDSAALRAFFDWN
jgi:nucleoid-associated protein YgaU